MQRNPDLKMYDQFVMQYVDCALNPSEVKRNVPLRFHPEVDDFTMSMGMARTPGGRIWLGWFAGADGDKAVMLLAKSDDDGKSFSEPCFFLDPGYSKEGGIHLSAVVGNLWSAPDGRLFLFFSESFGYYDGRAGSWYSICGNPDSDSPEWSVPQRIWHGASLNKPTVLNNGTWLLPISLWPREKIRIETHYCWAGEKSILFPELDSERKAHVFASTDQGKTWEKRGGVVNLEPDFDEHMIAERKDGSLLMYLRSKHGMTQCESFDEGYTWSDVVRTPFSSANARFFLRKLQSGNFLLVKYSNPEEPAVRSHLTAYISRDDGKNWEGGLLLDERSGVSYPDGFQAEDGRIFIQYDYRRECGEILLAIFTEADVLAGKNVSGKVLLKHTVVQSRSRRLEKEALGNPGAEQKEREVEK